jgi:hypothetical protein
MELLEFFKQLFIIAFGVLAALVLAVYVVWPKIESLVFRLNSHNQHSALMKDKQQLVFTAYERLLLFAHRISPYEVMLRNHNANLSIQHYKQALINDVENEFQHNFTQQLYVSDNSWSTIQKLKEDTVALFKNTAQTMPREAAVDDYIALVLKHVAELDVNPYEAAQVILKKELSA